MFNFQHDEYYHTSLEYHQINIEISSTEAHCFHTRFQTPKTEKYYSCRIMIINNSIFIKMYLSQHLYHRYNKISI